MPRNDQITRQWHRLRRLEGSSGLTSHELVDGVPDNYPKNDRTVRRDLEALEAVRFPGHLRKDVRMFAVERIRSITLTDHPYQMPLGFDVENYVQDALMIMRGLRIDVELLFTKKVAAWVKDKLCGIRARRPFP